jgi:hypothetical protein
MSTLPNILYLLENFNALIKYHIKAYKEGLPDERKIPRPDKLYANS